MSTGQRLYRYLSSGTVPYSRCTILCEEQYCHDFRSIIFILLYHLIQQVLEETGIVLDPINYSFAHVTNTVFPDIRKQYVTVCVCVTY